MIEYKHWQDVDVHAKPEVVPELNTSKSVFSREFKLVTVVAEGQLTNDVCEEEE